jgi:hypothetical protein
MARVTCPACGADLWAVARSCYKCGEPSPEWVRRVANRHAALYPVAIMAGVIVTIAYLAHWGSIVLHGK